jgi:hypothetical protein
MADPDTNITPSLIPNRQATNLVTKAVVGMQGMQ